MSKRRKQAGGEAGAKRSKVRDVFVPRPFEGLAGEADWIALRELVPAASSPVRLRPEYGDREVTVATVLPMAWPALTKPDGRIFLGLQRHQQSGDVSRDIAVALLNALEVTDLGGPVTVPPLPGEGPRLQDILVDGALDVTVHTGFNFWLDNDPGDDPTVAASLERANASVQPTTKLAAVPAAYWCRVPEKAHVRWVLTEAEEPALAALARLGADGALPLGENTKFAGMFRAHGRLVPVWDLPPDVQPEEWETPLAEFAKRYAEAVASDAELTAAERRTRQGLLGRQLTLR
ncbi:DUF5926 family protein [Luedemannella helvata]|uniref:DUF5926 family protein n=1 Tax=Luedemannella helvata TaxID=349315 RepID=A0ABP4WLP7_9ACTN